MEKIEILKRLLKDGHITVDEFIVLYENEKQYVYIPSTTSYTYPYRF